MPEPELGTAGGQHERRNAERYDNLNHTVCCRE
jgi:hypothetical protein